MGGVSRRSVGRRSALSLLRTSLVWPPGGNAVAFYEIPDRSFTDQGMAVETCAKNFVQMLLLEFIFLEEEETTTSWIHLVSAAAARTMECLQDTCTRPAM